MKLFFLRWHLCALFLISSNLVLHSQTPNILLVIADDLGVDYSNGYHNGNLMPTTPTLDSLRATGITFENVFATPKCTPSRASILSGKYGNKTGVLGTPGNLDLSHTSIFKAIEEQTNNLYSDAVIGKWHVSQPVDPLPPSDHGIDYYSGLLTAMVDDYYEWERSENGETFIENTYVTTALTDASIDWINDQTQPWFLWLAHAAPHAPFQAPPDSLYTIGNTGNNRRTYVAMIEALDHELGRLLDNIPPEELENTLIIFLGDNGTPNGVLQDYPTQQGKATLFQGGIRVPFIVSGAGVERIGERESALVHITDLYATLLEVVGAELPGGIFNSLSFKHLLNNTEGNTRDYNFSEQNENGSNEFTIRNSRYKLIESITNETQAFYDLLEGSLETTNLLLDGLTPAEESILADLEAEALQIRNAWSCRDHIQNGDEDGIDCGGTYCTPCNTTDVEEQLALEAIDIFPNPVQNEVQINTPEGNYSMNLIDVTGNSHKKVYLSRRQQIINLDELPSGIYFLQIIDQENQTLITQKIIKSQ
jgi:arylsulfatase A-like enzyme